MEPQAPCSKETLVLNDLHVARCGLSTDRSRLRNRAQTQDIALLKRQTKARLAQVERQIAELAAEIAALIEAHEATARSRDILCSMPGIGSFTAAAMDSAAGNRHAGTRRRAFAWFQAIRHPGPLVWILTAHAPEMPMLRGLPLGIGERLHLLRPTSEIDLLWCIEETLRAAPVALVIAEPSPPLSLTAGRRFQLAAESGGTTGLLLIQTDAGSKATETRWSCEPTANARADATLHQWTLKKNKQGAIGDWVVNWHGASAAFHMMPKAGERHQPAEPAR